MIKIPKSQLFSLYIWDGLGLSLAWVSSYLLRFYSAWDTPLGIPPLSLYLKLWPFILIIWLGQSFATGFYRRSSFRRSAFTEALDIIPAAGLLVLGIVTFSYFYEEYRYSRLTLVIFSVLCPLTLIAFRSLWRKWFRLAQKSLPVLKAMVVGDEKVLDLALKCAQTQGLSIGLKIPLNAGVFIDEDRLKAWQSLILSEGIQVLYWVMDLERPGQLGPVLKALGDKLSDIKIITDLSPYTRLNVGCEMIQGVPVISVNDHPLEGLGGFIKRLMDIVGSFLALFLLSPVMLLLGLLVKASSPGPVFYRQKRMGVDGKIFDCLKFRSMPLDAELGGPKFAHAGDQRATPLGKLMRRTSLDELPQFYNVLKGEMSLVGPRPERPVFVEQFREQIPGYWLRHRVKAGITGWAQVNGWRGDTSIEKRIECDLYYIQNWSFALDLKILFMTVKEVLGSKNAY